MDPPLSLAQPELDIGCTADRDEDASFRAFLTLLGLDYRQL